MPELDPRLFRASALLRASPTTPMPTDGARDAVAWLRPDAWGRLIELTGDHTGACTSLAVSAVLQAQAMGETTAWLQPRHGLLFPPDLAANGVDLDALLVVHVPPAGRATGRAAERTRHDLPKAAELLLRCGAFGLLVLDLRPEPPPRGAWVHRLQALAREHRSLVLLLTDAHAPADLGAGLALRLQPQRARDGELFAIEARVLKDKRGDRPLPRSVRSGPPGLS